jgi:hypothetical protein
VALEAQPYERGNRLRDYRVSAPSSQLIVRILRRSLPDLFFCIRSRWNYVSAARPFAQIDGAAALAAKGKLGIAALDHFLADRAAKLQCGLARHNQGLFQILAESDRSTSG